MTVDISITENITYVHSLQAYLILASDPRLKIAITIFRRGFEANLILTRQSSGETQKITS